MKFGSQLEQYKQPEWASFYLDFLALRKKIKQLRLILKGRKFDMIDIRDLIPGAASSHAQQAEEIAIENLERNWVQSFLREVLKLSKFYCEKKLEYMQELEETFQHVQKHHGDMKALVRKSDHYDPRQRLPSILRALQIAHRNMWCLEVYSEINYLACIKILKKFKKVSSLDTQVVWRSFVEPSAFMRWKELQPYRKRIYEFIAECITEGDRQRAKELIRQGEEQYGTMDMIVIGGCLGVSVVPLFESLLLVYELDDFSKVFPSLPIYRVTLGVVFVLWCAAWVVSQFERFSINWIYIFEIKSRSTISSTKLMMMASVFSVLWAVLFLIHGFYIRYFFDWEERDFVTMLTLLIFFFVLFVPFDVFYYKLRVEMLRAIWEIVKSPFGIVDFRHFLIADVLTSLSRPISDLYRGVCNVSSVWVNGQAPKCYGQDWILAIISTLPIYWRLAQCLRRYYVSKDYYPHLLNAGKYALALVVLWLIYLRELIGVDVSLVIWIQLYILSTLYMLTWDLVVDWGLFSLHNFQLRDRRLYPRSYYILAVLGDTILRFNWILTLLPVHTLQNPFLDVEAVVLISSFLEISRRAFWTLFRVENEKFSNIEKYRQVDFVPKIPTLIVD